MNISAPSTSQGLHRTFNVMPFLGAVFTGTPSMWYIAGPVHWLPWKKPHLFYPMWLLSSWSSICNCNEKGMIIHLPFIATPSIIVSSCLMGQYPHTVSSKSSLLCDQPLIMYVCSICSSASIFVVFLMSSTDVHTRTSNTVLSSVYDDVHTTYFLVFALSLILMG